MTRHTILIIAHPQPGKTGAFCLPILQTVWETLRDLSDAKRPRPVAAATAIAVPEWTMSLHDRGTALAITGDGLRCQSREQNEWHGGRATTGVHPSPGTANHYYYEATVTDEGLCRIGWSTASASHDLGTDALSFGFGGTGKKSHNRQFTDYGRAYGLGDVIGCSLDWTDRGEIRFSLNGADLGPAFRLPAALRLQTLYPACVLKNAEIALNFGGEPFKFAPPAGAVACTAAGAVALPNPLASGAASDQPLEADATLKLPPPNAPQAVIIEPSRELAEQTAQQLSSFGRHLKQPTVRQLLLVGGVNVRDQLAALAQGCDIVVATPGRLEDLISGGHLSLGHCRFFVLDEADALLQQGHTKLIDSLHRQMPRHTAGGSRRLQMVVCSATLHALDVKRMAERLMHFPVWIDLKGEDAVPETVHHVAVLVDPRADTSWRTAERRIRTDGVHAADALGVHVQSAEQFSEATKWLKGAYLLRALEQHRMERALLFCRTKLDCDNVERWLREADAERWTCVCLHGDRAPAERKANLAAFKEGRVKFMICTDVAARGLDISGLPFSEFVCSCSTMPAYPNPFVAPIGSDQRYDARREGQLCASHWTRRPGGSHGTGHQSGVDGAGEGVVPRLVVSVARQELLEHAADRPQGLLHLVQ